MRPLHVVQVPRRFVREEWGGTETVVLETSKRLLARGHRTEILCPNALAASSHETIDGVSVIRTPYFYPYWGLSDAARRQLDHKGGNLFSFSLLRALKRLPELDLIHVHTLGRVGGIARSVARKRRIPYVVSLHGGAFDMPSEERQDLIAPMQSAFDWGKALGWWVGSRHVLDDAAAVLCVGQREQELVQERLPSQRVEYLPNGVDPLRFAQGDRARFRRERGIPEDARVLLTMGRIDPQKNQALAVRTLAILRREEPRLHLVLIGPVTSSTYRAELERIAQDLGLAEFVHILPGMRADDPALVDAYHAADVFVLPSVHEPFGIVILEAWCAGLPVLASRVGGIPYFVEDGVDGALFDPHDETDLVRAYHALASGRMRECAAAGRAKALREYTWDAVVTRLIRIYEEVVNAHSVRQ